MKKDGKKNKVKELKEMKVSKLDIALGTLCPPAELGVLVYKYVVNDKVKKANELEEQELENMIKSKKTENNGETDKVE